MKKCITSEVIQQYATVSQDMAAIHLEKDAAVKAGFKRPIAHGMYLMGLAQSIYIEKHPGQWITQYEMKFHKPMLVDTVARFEFEPDGESRIKVTVTADDDTLIASGAFSVKEVQE